MPQIFFAGRMFIAIIAGLAFCQAAGRAVAAQHPDAVFKSQKGITLAPGITLSRWLFV